MKIIEVFSLLRRAYLYIIVGIVLVTLFCLMAESSYRPVMDFLDEVPAEKILLLTISIVIAVLAVPAWRLLTNMNQVIDKERPKK